ncbi:MAG: S4 domain-containing protein, partial [Novosphingopyxis baekryungensis]|nr:S4 domain-containing protein [Novosphingopyxis baekryungensis]
SKVCCAVWAAQQTFEGGGAGSDLPSIAISEPISILDAYVELGLVASKKEARRLIDGGGARLDGEPVEDPQLLVSAGQEPVRLSAGKKKHGLIIAA